MEKKVIQRENRWKLRNYAACSLVVSCKQILDTEVIVYLLPHASEIKDLSIQMSQNLEETLVLFGS